MITSLTDKQQVRLKEWYEECLRIGTSTAPANRKLAEQAIAEMYTIVGNKLPEFVWCTSPAEAVNLIALLKKEEEKKAWNSVEDVKKSIANVQNVKAKGKAEDNKFRDTINESIYGQYEQFWIGFYQFCEEIGVKYPEDSVTQLKLWADIAKSCNWWFPYEKVCVICERPKEININDDLVLHNDSGPAIRFRDDWSIWAINGVDLEKDGEQIVMHPETQTLEQIQKEQNVEIKRIRIERFGWENYLTLAEAEVIEHRTNDIEQCEESLMRCDNMTILVCACPSTGRVYSLEVPETCKTCEEAQDYLSGGRAKAIIGAS